LRKKETNMPLSRVFIPVLAAVLLFGFQGWCVAGKIDAPISTWKKVEFQGKITYISPQEDFIVASERKIILVDMHHGGKQYRTNILDSQGRKISFHELKEGLWVYVRGGLLPDNTVGARSIFLLPGQVDENKMSRDYPALMRLHSWGQ